MLPQYANPNSNSSSQQQNGHLHLKPLGSSGTNTDTESEADTENETTILQRQIASLRLQNQSLSAENDQLKQANQSLTAQLAEQEQQIEELDELDTEYNAVINELETQLNSLSDSLNDKNAVIDDLNARILLLNTMQNATIPHSPNVGATKLNLTNSRSNSGSLKTDERHISYDVDVPVVRRSRSSSSERHKIQMADEVDMGVLDMDEKTDKHNKTESGLEQAAKHLGAISEQHSVQFPAQIMMELSEYYEKEKTWNAEIEKLQRELQSTKKVIVSQREKFGETVKKLNAENRRLMMEMNEMKEELSRQNRTK